MKCYFNIKFTALPLVPEIHDDLQITESVLGMCSTQVRTRVDKISNEIMGISLINANPFLSLTACWISIFN
jgi:hypothetical protein